MAGKQTTLTYGKPFKVAFGDLWFTVTKVEFTSALGEYPKGGIELVPTSLGLTVGLVAAAWATPLSEVKATEEKKGGYKSWPSEIRLFGKTEETPDNIALYKTPVLTIIGAGAEKKAGLEAEEAETKTLAEYSALVFAFGK